MSSSQKLINYTDVVLTSGREFISVGFRGKGASRVNAYYVGTLKQDKSQPVFFLGKIPPSFIDSRNDVNLILFEQAMRFNPGDWTWNEDMRKVLS